MESHKIRLDTDWPDLPPWWLVTTTRASAFLGLSAQTLLRWSNRGLGPLSVPKSYLKPTKGDPIYYRYHDVKAWAAERFGQPINFAEDTQDFIRRNCPKFSGVSPAATYAGQFDWYYKDDFSALRRGWKLRFFDEEFLMRFEDLYLAQPKRTTLGKAKDDLHERLDAAEGRHASIASAS